MKIIEDISNFIFIKNQPQKADIIFIPGGSYAEIAEEAAKLWHGGYSRLILPSGKYSVTRGYFPGPYSKGYEYSGKFSTEWEFLRYVLIKNGVEEDSILREDKAEFTYQNALLSKEITDSLELEISKAIICCKSFHARRCLMYYEYVFPQTEFVICPSDVQNISRENWFKSEVGIEKVMGELTRCGSQFKDMLKAIDFKIDLVK